jgi:hypothetical protein
LQPSDFLPTFFSVGVCTYSCNSCLFLLFFI